MTDLRNWVDSYAVVPKIEAAVQAAIASQRIRKTIVSLAAAFLIFQLYFIRELLAAELLFGVVFAFWLLLVGVIYLVGTVGEHGLEWADRGLRFFFLKRLRRAMPLPVNWPRSLNGTRNRRGSLCVPAGAEPCDRVRGDIDGGAP
jgi:hypothetical protein